MKFDKHFPSAPLQPYIKHYVVAETEWENEYKVFPATGLVIGFQYKGKLSIVQAANTTLLSTAGITGITDAYKVFKNSAGIGSVLIYFTETGFTHFTAHPAHELFNLSVSLQDVFDKKSVTEVEEKLAAAITDQQRIQIIERFLLSHLKDIQTDKLIIQAVQMIYQTGGTIRIKELQDKLFISQSPFEKRFRKLVGTTPKKFASIVRFNSILTQLHNKKSLLDICYENNFFDQSHFTKDFQKFTGHTPDNFKHLL